MVDWFKQLTPAAKMLIVVGALSVLLVVVISQLGRVGNTDQPEPTPLTPGSTENPDPGVADPSDPITPPDPVNETPSPSPTLPQETELSLETQQEAMDTAVKGFLEYYDMSADESLEARQQRLSPYFDTTVPVFTESPLGEFTNSDGGLKVYSEASLNFSEPIGGSADAFYVLIGATVRGQITPPEDSGELPYIRRSTMVIFEVELSQQDSTWKITDITEK